MEKNQKIEELRGLETEFDFENLFSGKSKYGAALRVITPSQEITVPTLSHADAAKKIMEVLYDDFDGTLNIEESFSDDLNKRKAVAILMMNGSFEIIYIPDVINTYQFERLVEFKKEMDDLCKNTGRKIELYTNIFKDGKRKFQNTLQVVEERVDDNYDFPNENMIYQTAKTI